MTDDATYRELIGNDHIDPADLSEWIGMVEEQLDQRSAKTERLRAEIARLEERGEATDTQRASVQTIEEECTVLRARLAELQQQADAPIAQEPEEPSDFLIGGIAQVTQDGGLSLELRTRPGLSDSGRIGHHPPGTQVTLLDGPTYMDEHTWWRVRRDDGREGWIADDGLVGRPD